MGSILGLDLETTKPDVVRVAIDRRERELYGEIGLPTVASLDAEPLDTDPLPEESFDWSSVAADDRDRVSAVLERLDAICEAQLDLEFRTVCRIYLARVVESDPKVFRRARPELIAAGLAWAAVREQDIDPADAPHLILAHGAFAIGAEVHPTTMNQRANSMGAAIRRYELAHGIRGPWHSLRRRTWRAELDQIAAWRRRVDEAGR